MDFGIRVVGCSWSGRFWKPCVNDTATVCWQLGIRRQAVQGTFTRALYCTQCSVLGKMWYFADLQASLYKTNRNWVNVLTELLSRSMRTNAVPRVLYKGVKGAVLRVLRNLYYVQATHHSVDSR
jgi:hypothetical protein